MQGLWALHQPSSRAELPARLDQTPKQRQRAPQRLPTESLLMPPSPRGVGARANAGMRVFLSKAVVIDLSSPAVKANGARFWVGGESGSGKSTVVISIVEQVIAQGGQVVILDSHGEYGQVWALNPATVRRIGYGDAPVDENSVEECLAIVDEGHSLLLDLSHWADLYTEKIDAFAREFLRGFYEMRRRDPKFTLLILEEAHIYCMPLDTEILTPGGWKKRTEVAVGDPVVVFDPSTETYKVEPILKIIDRQYKGPMMRFKTKRLDCLVTPDHRVVLRRTQRAGPKRYFDYPLTFCRAEDAPSNVKIPFGGAPENLGLEDWTLEELRVLGWAITDGCRHSKRCPAVVLSQGVNTSKLGANISLEMKRVLGGMGAKITVRHQKRRGTPTDAYNFYIPVPISKKYIDALQGMPTKLHRRIPRYILESGTTAQLRALWRGLLDGDGAVQNGRWRAITPGKGLGLADDIQELAIRLGISATIVKIQGSQWEIRIRNDKNVEHTIRRRPTTEQFEGMTWDITVNSGAFVARRNGTTFVTGNCPQLQMQGQTGNIKIVTALVTGGRKYGIQLAFTTQRQALVDSNVLAQCNARIFLRSTDFRDWKRVGKFIPPKLGITYDEEGSGLRYFRDGEAVVLTPWTQDVRVMLRQPKTALRRYAT